MYKRIDSNITVRKNTIQNTVHVYTVKSISFNKPYQYWQQYK